MGLREIVDIIGGSAGIALAVIALVVAVMVFTTIARMANRPRLSRDED